jgi:hypothetical protein
MGHGSELPSAAGVLLKAQIWEESMRAIVAAGALVALVSPALAAETFYVEQDTATKRCRVVLELPSATAPANIQVVGPQDAAYMSRADAEAAIKALKVCELDDSAGSAPAKAITPK